MKIDLTQEIYTLGGEPYLTADTRMVEKKDAEGKVVLVDGEPVMVSEPVPMTVRYLLINAFSNVVQGVSLTEKVSRGVIAQRIHRAGRTVEMTVEELAKAKDLLDKVVHSPVILLRMMEILDPASIPQTPRDSVDCQSAS